jgi:hypothetical protein
LSFGWFAGGGAPTEFKLTHYPLARRQAQPGHAVLRLGDEHPQAGERVLEPLARRGFARRHSSRRCGVVLVRPQRPDSASDWSVAWRYPLGRLGRGNSVEVTFQLVLDRTHYDGYFLYGADRDCYRVHARHEGQLVSEWAQGPMALRGVRRPGGRRLAARSAAGEHPALQRRVVIRARFVVKSVDSSWSAVPPAPRGTGNAGIGDANQR